MKKTTVCLLAAVFCAFAGCQQTTANNPPKKTGTYAAARQNRVGSNIPQAYSADSVNATVDPDQFSRAGNQQMNLGQQGGGTR